MTTITVPFRLWARLSDIVQDVGNHHPLFAGTDTGRDLDVLGAAIKYGVPMKPEMMLDSVHVRLLDAAKVVIEKHGKGRPELSIVEQSIETAEHLFGLWRSDTAIS